MSPQALNIWDIFRPPTPVNPPAKPTPVQKPYKYDIDLVLKSQIKEMFW